MVRHPNTRDGGGGRRCKKKNQRKMSKIQKTPKETLEEIQMGWEKTKNFMKTEMQHCFFLFVIVAEFFWSRRYLFFLQTGTTFDPTRGSVWALWLLHSQRWMYFFLHPVWSFWFKGQSGWPEVWSKWNFLSVLKFLGGWVLLNIFYHFAWQQSNVLFCFAAFFSCICIIFSCFFICSFVYWNAPCGMPVPSSGFLFLSPPPAQGAGNPFSPSFIHRCTQVAGVPHISILAAHCPLRPTSSMPKPDLGFWICDWDIQHGCFFFVWKKRHTPLVFAFGGWFFLSLKDGVLFVLPPKLCMMLSEFKRQRLKPPFLLSMNFGNCLSHVTILWYPPPQ